MTWIPRLISHQAARYPSVTVAACLAVGIWTGTGFAFGLVASGMLLVCLTSTLILTSRQPVYLRSDKYIGTRPSAALLCAGCVLAGVMLVQWRMPNSPLSGQLPESLSTAAAVRASGIVSSIPVLRTKQESFRSSEMAAAEVQTVFICRLQSLDTANSKVQLNSTLRVIVDGDVAQTIQWSDQIALTGKLESTFTVNNPGEFDYQRFLERQNLDGVFFVQHPQAVSVTAKHPWWHPKRLLNQTRLDATRLIGRHLSPTNQPLAEALLLGNRGHLQDSTERQFIASGTMHLLAISGLHTGILFLFILRILNLLFVEHRRALILATICCILYALLTDLRPSVFRATVFITLSSLSQLYGRQLRMPALIGNTLIVLLVVDPLLIFDSGAWLSFLAVTALAWVEGQRSENPVSRDLPPDVMTWREQLSEFVTQMRGAVSLRYRQMFAVTLFSLPLVASQFHIVSVSGMIVNILLIPFTAVTMVAGFLFLASGLLVPPMAFAFSTLFSGAIWILNTSVALSSAARLGFVTIADLPGWFLPTYYGLLALLVCSRWFRIKNRILALQFVCLLIAFSASSSPPATNELTCTVLSVGHGNATVVITPRNRVIVFDAGSLHRGQRTADVLARYLWHRGYRMIDAIIISHADADHYNAVQPLLDVVPVGQIITTQEFIESTAEPIASLLGALKERQIPVNLVHHADHVSIDELTLRFLKANPASTPDLTDNELSLLSVLEYQSCSIALPGDLDGRGFEQIADTIEPADFLVSPHHGSLASNTHQTRETYQPTTVIVSSRSDEHQAQLNAIFHATSECMFTSVSGAVTIHIEGNSKPRIRAFR